MNTETLTSTNNTEVQPAKSIEINALPGSKNDAERASCRNGVCEVAWKPFDKSNESKRSNKLSG
ncbi:MAG: hypothetical protein SGJ27_21105 [Candidatus Melainabacteria bacterium]|nr:hypothetical protein [Candidatus Melainabacteria bacterium]